MTTRSDLLQIAALTGLLAAAVACQPEPRNQTGSGTTAAADTSRRKMTGDMQGMQGMQGMHQDTVTSTVEAHLRRLASTNADTLSALMPADREVVTALIADCEQMIRQMKMDPPRKWRNAVQELRQDLDHMRQMSGAQLRTAMPEHRKRIEGMLAMRRDMMRM
ncbi:MAG: hypothetical protein NVS4B3_19220 [Gemmatimonadaceae bacterium]